MTVQVLAQPVVAVLVQVGLKVQDSGRAVVVGLHTSMGLHATRVLWLC